MEKDEIIAEPFKIKMVEPIKLLKREKREKRIKDVGYNVFGLKRDDVYIDLLTDSGTSAMSDNQWAGIMMGDESYAGCRSYQHLEKAVQDVLGFKYFIPTHQGRPAESFLFRSLVKEGSIVPFNMPFDSTAANVKVNGGKPVSCVADIAYKPQEFHPFKGNIDLDKLHSLIEREGVEKIPFIMVTLTNNTGGGQPVSMSNLKEIRKLSNSYNIPVFYDAARCVENAYFIQQRENGYKNKTIAEIVREQFSYADGCTFSCKKDALVNMGGLIAMNDESLYRKIIPLLVLLEGFITYGGMSGRDLEALARGLYEMLDDDYIAYRVEQVRYLGEKINDIGIKTVLPIGGHAVYVDAADFFPHIPQSQFPADTLAVELYKESGVRGIGLGALAFAEKDEKTGEEIFPKMELFRLAVPRRVYTYRHMDFVVEGLRRVYERRNQIKGLKVVSETTMLRHFLSRLQPV